MISVLVLLSTYNGEQFIEEQIKSLLDQEGIDIRILIRDDGSSDGTVDIIKNLQQSGKIDLVLGENIGYAKSFMTLIHLAANQVADYYAFCDQDDIWESNKLKVAVTALGQSRNEPALYLSQAKIVDSNLKAIDTTFHKRKVDLGSVLEHNYAIGCTMVFNENLRSLLDINLSDMSLTCGHDSWVYLVALAIDAQLVFDLNGYVLYRQHGTNASGKIISVQQGLNAVKKILFTWKNARCDSAKKIIKSYKNRMSTQNYELLYEAAEYQSSIKNKIQLLKNRRMKSDYLFVDFLYKFSVIFNLF